MGCDARTRSDIFCAMSRVHRYRSLLLAFCTLMLVLIAGTNVASGLHRHHAPFAHGTVSTQATTGDHAVVHDAHDPFTGDASSGVSLLDDDCDVDDQLVVPEPAYVPPRVLGSDVLADKTPGLRSAAAADLLRPPRAA
jgi:hypothetical protein